MTNIKPGDVVWLKAGGLPMTVNTILNNNQSASCDWFDEQNKLNSSVFSISQLTKEKPQQSK